ncbi:MAG: dihydroneopterin aldolase [Propionibacteriaceae bacterium]|nr:dihydroneopterin aldolase [Propionibacteriaceae bacterium]
MLTIAVTGISCEGVHGVMPSELANPQEFLVDIECVLNRTSNSDDLATTVDYEKLVNAAIEVIGAESCQLLETLAVRIAEHCLADALISEIMVRVHKPFGPLAPIVADSYAQIRLKR